MTSILADRQYTLNLCQILEKEGNIQELEEHVIVKINKIAGRVGAPSYQKTPKLQGRSQLQKRTILKPQFKI